MMKDSLVKKFLKFSYGSWVGLVLGLLTTMIITRLLPPDSFGKMSMFDLSLQVVMIFTVFGTDQAFIRFFYEEELEKRGGLLYNSLRIPIISTLIILVLLFVWYKPITYFLFENTEINYVVWLSIGIIAQLLLRYSRLVIRMQQKGNLYSLIQIIEKVFELIFILLLFRFIGAQFEVLVYSKVITISMLVIIAIYFGRNIWHIRGIKQKNLKHSQSDILKFGAPFVLTIFIAWIFESFDKIALRQWSDFSELGLYTAAMKIVALVMVLKTTFSTFWTPVAYERFEKKPKDKNFFRQISIIVSFAMFLVSIVSIAGKDIIVNLLGAEYKEAATIMPFLVFIPLFYTISQVTFVGINFYKKTKWHIPIAGISAVINIIGNWLLVPEYGAIGASISTAFSFVIFFTLRTYISMKYYYVNYPLFRIYFMTAIIALYASYSILTTSFWLNILLSLIPLILLILIFYKDLKYLIANRKLILD